MKSVSVVRIKIMSTSYRNRIEVVSKVWVFDRIFMKPNARNLFKRLRWFPPNDIEVVSKSYQNRIHIVLSRIDRNRVGNQRLLFETF